MERGLGKVALVGWIVAQGAVLKWTLGFPSFSFVNPSDVFNVCLGVSLPEGPGGSRRGMSRTQTFLKLQPLNAFSSGNGAMHIPFFS